MKCDKCGYSDNGSGDMAHVCSLPPVRPSEHAVAYNRLLKKTNKMKDQRDKARADLTHYKHILQELPYLQKRYELYQEMKQQRETIRLLQIRVKEQSLLIDKLTT